MGLGRGGGLEGLMRGRGKGGVICGVRREMALLGGLYKKFERGHVRWRRLSLDFHCMPRTPHRSCSVEDQDVKSRILRILKCQDGGVGVEGALEDSSRQLGRNWGSVLIGFVLMGFCCGNSEVDPVCCSSGGLSKHI